MGYTSAKDLSLRTSRPSQDDAMRLAAAGRAIVGLNLSHGMVLTSLSVMSDLLSNNKLNSRRL